MSQTKFSLQSTYEDSWRMRSLCIHRSMIRVLLLYSQEYLFSNLYSKGDEELWSLGPDLTRFQTHLFEKWFIKFLSFSFFIFKEGKKHASLIGYCENVSIHLWVCRIDFRCWTNTGFLLSISSPLLFLFFLPFLL